MARSREGPRTPKPRNRTRGSVSIEAVVVIPLFIAAMFAILQGSLWVYASTVAQAAAQDGARAATVMGGNPQSGQTTAEGILEYRSTGVGWGVETSSTLQTLTVTVTGYAQSVIPGLRLHVQESATLPWEGQSR
ncbi:MAG: pilus assembly protein [Propionibacteriaceae bacterium]|nr:pilus assembly protein [Propionibacteriaceae bacterium]